MSAIMDTIDVDALIPDGIEPVEEWRTWLFDGTHLLSHNATKWTPGEPLEATCVLGESKVWALARRGWSLAEATAAAQRHNHRASFSYNYSPGQYLRVPTVEPPDGFGYVIETVTHASPHVGCSCGIYAGRTPGDCPGGDILGKVKLWGTIVPGEKGARGQYGYPSELHVPAHLADVPALIAYGVPIVSKGTPEFVAPGTAGKKRRKPGPLAYAVAANLSGCALNLGMVARHLL